MQTPIARGVALRGNAAASGLSFHRALGAFDFHVARAGSDFHVAGCSLLELHTAAATGSRQSSSDSDRANAATACCGARCAVNSVEFDLSRSGARMGFSANVAEVHTAGPA